MDNAIPQVPDPAQFRDGFRQDIVHAVIVGPTGQMTAERRAFSRTRAPRRSRPWRTGC